MGVRAAAILAVTLAAGAGAALRSRAGRRTANFSFEGRSVVVTGGSRGLGLVIARQFADEGAHLTILARDREELERAERDLASRGAEVLSIPCDVRERAQVEDAVARVIEHYGSIDVLVNNAGIVQVGPLEHMSLEDWQNTMAVNFWGSFYASMAAIPHMRAQGGGRIVNIASIGGKIALPHLLPYSASKFALIGFSDGIRAELAKDNIHVTTVAPGLLRTGSPYNAQFKGDHSKEFSWFLLLDSLPFTSISAVTAARQIVEACRRGAPDLTITIQARLGVLAGTIAPGLFGQAMKIYNRLLPRPIGREGDVPHTGWESGASLSLSRSALVRPTIEAAKENNEAFAHPL